MVRPQRGLKKPWYGKCACFSENKSCTFFAQNSHKLILQIVRTRICTEHESAQKPWKDYPHDRYPTKLNGRTQWTHNARVEWTHNARVETCHWDILRTGDIPSQQKQQRKAAAKGSNKRQQQNAATKRSSKRQQQKETTKGSNKRQQQKTAAQGSSKRQRYKAATQGSNTTTQAALHSLFWSPARHVGGLPAVLSLGRADKQPVSTASRSKKLWCFSLWTFKTETCVFLMLLRHLRTSVIHDHESGGR